MSSTMLDASTHADAPRPRRWRVPALALLGASIVLTLVGIAVLHHQAAAWSPPISADHAPGCGFRGAGCARTLAARQHLGQDYPAPAGTPVLAVHAGTVLRSESITSTGNCRVLPTCGDQALVSYGNLIVIELAGGGNVQALYAHLTERHVTVGDTVHAGEVIGTVGYQGNVAPRGPEGSHLYFEIKQDGHPVDPIAYLRSKGIPS